MRTEGLPSKLSYCSDYKSKRKVFKSLMLLFPPSVYGTNYWFQIRGSGDLLYNDKAKNWRLRKEIIWYSSSLGICMPSISSQFSTDRISRMSCLDFHDDDKIMNASEIIFCQRIKLHTRAIPFHKVDECHTCNVM